MGERDKGEGREGGREYALQRSSTAAQTPNQKGKGLRLLRPKPIWLLAFDPKLNPSLRLLRPKPIWLLAFDKTRGMWGMTGPSALFLILDIHKPQALSLSDIRRTYTRHDLASALYEAQQSLRTLTHDQLHCLSSHPQALRSWRNSHGSKSQVITAHDTWGAVIRSS